MKLYAPAVRMKLTGLLMAMILCVVGSVTISPVHAQSQPSPITIGSCTLNPPSIYESGTDIVASGTFECTQNTYISSFNVHLYALNNFDPGSSDSDNRSSFVAEANRTYVIHAELANSNFRYGSSVSLYIGNQSVDLETCWDDGMHLCWP